MKRFTLAFVAAAAALLAPAHAEELHFDLQGTYPSNQPSGFDAAPGAPFELSFQLADTLNTTPNRNVPSILYAPVTNFVYQLKGRTLVSEASSTMQVLLEAPSYYAQFILEDFFYDFVSLNVSVDPSHPWMTLSGTADKGTVAMIHPGTYDVLSREGYDDSGTNQPATLRVSPVPEPSTLALVGGGAALAAAGAFLQRQGRGAPRES